MLQQPSERYFNIDAIIHIPRTKQGEAARSMALAMNDRELKAWCALISERNFRHLQKLSSYLWN